LISCGVSNTAWGSGGSSAADDIVTATWATIEKEAVDAAAAKKFVDDAAAAKKTTVDAAAMKKVADEAVVKKKAVDEAAAVKKAADDAAAPKKVVDDALTVGSSSSLFPSTGAKRAAAPSGSTPPTKR
jgi:membrane protein involved in colicin uptake